MRILSCFLCHLRHLVINISVTVWTSSSGTHTAQPLAGSVWSINLWFFFGAVLFIRFQTAQLPVGDTDMWVVFHSWGSQSVFWFGSDSNLDIVWNVETRQRRADEGNLFLSKGMSFLFILSVNPPPPCSEAPRLSATTELQLVIVHGLRLPPYLCPVTRKIHNVMNNYGATQTIDGRSNPSIGKKSNRGKVTSAAALHARLHSGWGLLCEWASLSRALSLNIVSKFVHAQQRLGVWCQ